MTRTKKPRADAHQIVTDAVIKFLESGETGKWQKPWDMLLVDGNYCPATKKTYNGFVNTMALNALAYANGFKSEAWGTYKQWKSLGTDDAPVSVMKGAKAAYIFVPMIYTKKDKAGDPITDSNGDKVSGMSFKQVPVFNADQVEGYTEVKPELPVSKVLDNAEVDRFVSKTGAQITHGGNRAFYSMGGDHVTMPPKEAFKDVGESTATEAYYGTLLHEMTHWTGETKRCNREMGTMFGGETYAFEELVAEMGAAIMCNQFGISDQPRADHAKYVKSWLKGLANDKNAVFKAVGLAQKAIKHLETYQ